MKSTNAVLALLVAAATLVACNTDDPLVFPLIDVDATPSAPSLAPDEVDDDDPEPSERERVELDLADLVKPTADGSEARVYRITDEAQLIGGDIAHGRVGDWVLENDRARYLIEDDDRVMNPCPYGGNVLDAAYKGGGNGEDMLGEVCLFVNGGLTLDPETFEVVESETGAAVLAVTGSLAVADFLNAETMIRELAPIQALPNDLDRLLPVSVTIYYILNPDDLGMRVVTAFRNDGEERVDLAAVHLIMSGGTGYYFNPMSPSGGFGKTGSETSPAAVPYIGFRGDESSYLYMPEPSENFDREIPVGGVSVTISGVAAVALGIPSVFNVLLATPEQLATMEGVLHLEPQAIDSVTHHFYAGDGSLSSTIDEALQTLGVETTVLSGRVVDADGAPLEGARVSAITTDRTRTMNQTMSGADGTFSMHVPRDFTYEVRARLSRARFAAAPPQVTTADATADLGDLEVTSPAKLKVNIARTDGSPTPARVTVTCVDTCPGAPTGNEMDVETDRLPADWAAIAWASVDGMVELELAPGDYRVSVTRGFEWSIWPTDAWETGGELINLEADDEITLDAEIEHVVDSAGALSGDFHIHSVPSPDSVVPHVERVMNFIAEGVEVMVATDHDYISDFEPAVTALGAEAEVATMSGAEITTSDIGHYNAFPLEPNAEHRRNGALDWSPGANPGLDPAEIFAWARDEHPGEQVIQVNHPRQLGMINMTDADPLRGQTFADREKHRLDPVDPDPITGDTRIWDDGFTAMELMTGGNKANFYAVGRWWLQMLGRGFTPTGTAVTDTHARYSDIGGSPRTFVFVPEGSDTPLTFDRDAFVEAVNAGRAVGSRGPFMRVSAENAQGTIATLGEVVATDGEDVTLRVELDLPEWMEVNTVDVFMNLRDEILTEPGETIEDPWTPTHRETLTWDAGTELHDVATGTTTHRHWKKTVEIPLQTDEDAYVIVVVSGSRSMAPVTKSDAPFAFSNPIFLDADGNGYDNPPLADLAAQPRTETRALRATEPVELTEEMLLEALQHGASCTH